MKILFTMTPAFDPNAGGVQRTTYKLGKYFKEQGLEVAYFSTSNIGHVKVSFGTLYYAQQPGGVENLNNINYLKQVLIKFKPDFVINQMPYVKLLRELLFQNKKDYVLLGCLRNSLFNFTSNVRDRMDQMLPPPIFKVMDNSLGISIVKKRHQIKHRKDLKAIIDQHDKFILLAPPNRKELSYFVGDYGKDKVLSISNSIPEVQEYQGFKEKIILHVGRLNIQQKRSDLLLKVWRKVHPELPDWEFIIVGDGPYMSKLREEIKETNISNVKLEGFQKPEKYYKKAPIFMMPSAYEGFPNTIIEAQSYGCIPVAFDSYAALFSIVNNNRDAVISPAFDVDNMAKKIVELAKDKKKTEKMAFKALENAQRFTINEVGKKWKELFDSLL